QVGGQVRLPDQTQVGASGIGIGEDNVGFVAAAIEQPHAPGPAVNDVDFGHLGVGGDLDPVLPVERGQGVGNGAHAAAHKAPGSLVAVNVADQVVVLDVGRARGAGSGVDADDATGAE